MMTRSDLIIVRTSTYLHVLSCLISGTFHSFSTTRGQLADDVGYIHLGLQSIFFAHPEKIRLYLFELQPTFTPPIKVYNQRSKTDMKFLNEIKPIQSF